MPKKKLTIRVSENREREREFSARTASRIINNSFPSCFNFVVRAQQFPNNNKTSTDEY